MKTRSNPDHYPLTKVSDTEYIEGYWRSPNVNGIEPIDPIESTELFYPTPLATDNPLDPVFIDKLRKIMKGIESKKYPNCDYLHYRGFSRCRLCNKYNGAKEYVINVDNIKYRFPEGLVHYYTDHNVHQSDEFYNVIMNFNDDYLLI